jgi:hypothetical protein
MLPYRPPSFVDNLGYVSDLDPSWIHLGSFMDRYPEGIQLGSLKDPYRIYSRESVMDSYVAFHPLPAPHEKGHRNIEQINDDGNFNNR